MATQLNIFRITDAAAPFTKAAELPNRVKVAKWGENPNSKGKPFLVGAKTLATLPALQKARGFDKVALDYEHGSVPRPGHKVAEPLPVAAYGTLDVVEGDGIYLSITEYTPSGKEHAANYADVSPAVEQDEDGNVLFVHSVGLCRQGSVYDLEYFSADFDKPAEEEKAKEPAAADMTAALAKLVERLNALEAKINAASTPAAPSATETFSAALENGLKDMTGKLETFAAELRQVKDQAERRKVVDKALGEGRIRLFTAEEEEALPLETLRTAYARSPKVVSLNRQTPAKVEEFSAAAAPEAEKANANQIKSRADALAEKNPSWPWSRCWSEAQRATAT